MIMITNLQRRSDCNISLSISCFHINYHRVWSFEIENLCIGMKEGNHKFQFSIDLIINGIEFLRSKNDFPSGIYLFKVNYQNTGAMCLICSKVTIKTPERRQWCRSGVYIVNFEHISHLCDCWLKTSKC